MSLERYSTLIFDCDGVILDSNRVKTAAFLTAATPYGTLAAAKLVEHHVTNGGVSRYAKFAYFLDHILPITAPDRCPADKELALATLLSDYGEAALSGLMNCPAAEGLPSLRSLTSRARWCIVSGGDEVELQVLFRRRGLARYFDAGIFGSPTEKRAILERELQSGNIRLPALYLGDSRLDHEVAMANGIDFVFVSQWTEFSDWRTYCVKNAITVIEALPDLAAGCDIATDDST